MSLINEALKKAQNERSPTPPATPPGGTPPPPAATSQSSAPQPSPFGKIGVLIAICAVIVSLSVLATVFLLRGPSKPSQPTTPAQPQRIAAADTAAAHANPDPTIPAEKTPAAAATNASTASAPNATAGNGSVSPAVAVGTASPSTAPVIAVPTATPTPSPEPTPVKPTVRIQALVDKFRISGIRISDTDSKVILNDHLFRVDDPVESSLGLRLTKIEEHRLTFVDADGNTYVKRF
jgi:hypothetical protein